MIRLLGGRSTPLLALCFLFFVSACSTEKEIPNTGVVNIETLRVPLLPHVDLIESKNQLYDKKRKTYISNGTNGLGVHVSPNRQRIAFGELKPTMREIVVVYDIPTGSRHVVFDEDNAKERGSPYEIQWVSDSVLRYRIFQFKKENWRELNLQF